ncbi:MAG TPA: (2Fe-2S)-binding protein [Candidatus Mediterraneibacter merdigallinarum]|nr:(2Fe-2S)-binding protein [Candidatus Mediterraneibacter merdigallinarum]
MEVRFILNQKQVAVDAAPDAVLMNVLRDLGCKSVKCGCETTNCGLCTVWIDGKSRLSCSVLAAGVEGHEVTTLEGVEQEAEEFGRFLAKEGAEQCGFCSPGFIMNVLAMMREYEEKAEKSGRASDAVPDVEEIKEYLAGNLCRCTGYMGQLRAIQNYMAEKKMTGENVPEKKEVRA